MSTLVASPIADTLLAAFTLPLNPGAPPFMTPRLLPSDPPGSGSASALAGRAAAPARHAHGQTSNAALKVTSADITMDAHLWQENVRLSQEALTLLRGILVDDVLGVPTDSSWSSPICHLSCLSSLAVANTVMVNVAKQYTSSLHAVHLPV